MTISSYDVDHPPSAEEWLAMDEGERILVVQEAHERTRSPVGQNAHAHATIHVAVENQLAEGYAPAVAAYERCRAAGLGRHNTIHALASVVTTHLYAALQGTPFDHEAAERDFQALDPSAFRPKKK